MSVKPLRAPWVALALLALLPVPSTSWAATPSLSYWAYNNVYGTLSTATESPALGSFSADFRFGEQTHYSDSTTGAVTPASSRFSIDTDASPAGADPLYDLVTSGGQYGFSMDASASGSGGALRTRASATTTDTSGQPVAGSPTSRLYGYANAQISEQYLIESDSRPAGSYGALLVGITLDGSFQPSSVGDAYASLNVSANFTDAEGVSFNSSFSTHAEDYSWSNPAWDGSETVYKKLLFQYGTPFSLSLYQWTTVINNGTADFSNTGQISSIEIPFASTLQTGATQRGLGTLEGLYGDVFTSATADAQNTNWDFANNGGGFTPPVPEPATYALMLGGLAAVALLARRRLPRR